MKTPLRLAAVLIPLWAGGALAAADKPVRLDSGSVTGIVENGIESWRGIPYAAPPLGNLRWREPQPVTPWTGVRKADAFSTTCMQSSSWDLQPRSEDCLTVNVWAPADHRGEKLPVMVWFHGGGLHSGSGSQPIFLGDQLPHHGVILVTVNYRLGVFGFFSHPELSTESPTHVSGNQGLLDQIAALRWVHRNIAAFGGDAKKVTIFGHSAGSNSVQALMTSPLTEGLFQAAIGGSGGETQPENPDQKLDAAERRGEQLGASLADLRALPAEELAAKPWQPRIILDGRAETRGVNETYAAHRQRDVPLMVGWAADEGPDIAGDLVKTTTADGFHKMLQGLFPGRPIPALFEERFPTDSEDRAKQSMVRFMQDAVGYGMWHWADEQHTQSGSPAYAYYFVHVPPEPVSTCYYGCRAGHGSELRYVFGHLDQDPRAWQPEDREIETRIIGYWTNFAKTGDPNGPGLPVWTSFDGKPDSVLRIGTPTEVAERGQFADFDAFAKSLSGVP